MDHSHVSHGRIRKYAVGPNVPRYGKGGSKISDEKFRAVLDMATAPDYNHQPGDQAFMAFKKIRWYGWGLSGRPDRLKHLMDKGFMWSWNEPEKSDKIREELEKYGWKRLWVKASDRLWYEQNRKPLASWVRKQQELNGPASPERSLYRYNLTPNLNA